MFGKISEKIEEQLVERVTALRFGWPLLLVLATLSAAYLAVSHVRSTPGALETFQDSRFVVTALAATSIFVSYIVWRSVTLPIPIRVLLTIVIAVITVYMTSRAIAIEPAKFRIDVVFDKRLNVDRSLLAAFFTGLPQDQIRVTIRDRDLLRPGTTDGLVYEQFVLHALPHVRPPDTTTYTVLVTDRHLSGGGWTNLFYFAGARLGVISTWKIESDVSLLRKYLAVMIPLIAMQGQAFASDRTFPKDRHPDLDHGCLSDFSIDRTLLIAKLRQGPSMCKEEQDEISSVFGSSVAAEFKSILATSKTGLQ